MKRRNDWNRGIPYMYSYCTLRVGDVIRTIHYNVKEKVYGSFEIISLNRNHAVLIRLRFVICF